MALFEQQIAEAESLTVDAPDDEVLLRTSETQAAFQQELAAGPSQN